MNPRCGRKQGFSRDGRDATALEAEGIRRGIVTNKMARFPDPLVRALGLANGGLRRQW